MLCVFQEGEEGKEEEEKEYFGKLEYSLDYSFTDNQVHMYTHLHIVFCKHTDQYPTSQTQKKLNEPNNRRMMPFILKK